MRLSVLCVTRAQPYALPFLRKMEALAAYLEAEFVVALDGAQAPPMSSSTRFVPVRSQGFLESVLDEAVAACAGAYILRLDDDEVASRAMASWLRAGEYLDQPTWSFPRAHFWGSTSAVLMTPHLFPDWQTRLSWKARSGGRPTIHAPSPWGGGEIAPVYIEHHKFLVRTRAEREDTAQRWHGGNMLPFSLPEDVYKDVELVEPGLGFVPWVPLWTRKESLRAAAVQR